MQKDKRLFTILMLPVLAMFIFGITKLLILRYEAGDVYPAYSSLRPDPLGTKALYEGIDHVQGFSSHRKYQPITKLKNIKKTSLFYIGIQPSYFLYMDKETVTVFEEIISTGNRLVMSFPPTQTTFFWDQEVEEEKEEEEDKEEEKETQNQTDEYVKKSISLTRRWGIDVQYAKLPDHTDTQAKLTRVFSQSSFNLPDAIPWHASLYFDILDRDVWRVIYTRDGHPVIVERELGKGTVVLCADSYVLSNEAMHRNRYPELLAWLVGANSEIIFDETHFGVIGTPGIASLIRKYRLGWFAAGLVFLALLFVWKNAFSFVPPPGDTTIEGTISDKDVTEGLINLLQRNIASRDILSVCFDEWKKSFTHSRKIPEKTYQEVLVAIETENARPPRDRKPVECYRTISKIMGNPVKIDD